MSMNEFAQGLEAMDPVELMLGAGVLGAMMMMVAVGGLVWYFISAIGYRKMFIKAGEAGWKAFVPVYKDYICFKFAWNVKAFWLFMGALALVQFLPETESLLVSLLGLAAAIVMLVVSIKRDIRVAKSFEKATGWGVLLFFFPFVVSLILGFGKAKYIGNTTCGE